MLALTSMRYERISITSQTQVVVDAAVQKTSTQSQLPAQTQPKPACTIKRNVLGGLNRELSAQASRGVPIDLKLADGTPPTKAPVDDFLKDVGYQRDANYAKMTYGPAIGLPYAIEALQSKISDLVDPAFQKQMLLNDGWQIASSIRERAIASVGGQTPEVWVFESLEDFHQKATADDVKRHLDSGNHIQVKLDSMLPVFKKTEHAPLTLSLEIVGNRKVYKQMMYRQGYVGPILAPVPQWLAEQELRNPGPREPIDCVVPPRKELEAAFLEYFNEKTGQDFTDGTVISGGCSGALYSILNHAEHQEAIICAPFFSPQKGIAECANKAVTVADGWAQFLDTLREKKHADVLVTIPNNPDGSIPSAEEIKKLVEIANKNGHRLVCDMTYFNCVKPEARNNYEDVVKKIKNADQYLMIASASKALALTKYRAALVIGDEKNLALVREQAPMIDSMSALALSAGLQPENRRAAEDSLNTNVKENTSWITQILNGEARGEEIAQLNSGLRKLHALVAKVGVGVLKLNPGDGALYGTLSVEEEKKQLVMDEAKTLGLVLIPGDIFRGEKLGIQTLLKTPQTSYRVSLMASPLANA